MHIKVTAIINPDSKIDNHQMTCNHTVDAIHKKETGHAIITNGTPIKATMDTIGNNIQFHPHSSYVQKKRMIIFRSSIVYQAIGIQKCIKCTI